MAAACCRKFEMGVVLAAAVVVMVAVVAGAARPDVKPRVATTNEYVYSYWSLSNAPAVLNEGYHYVSVGGLGGLEPEWDETNSTYYVRFTDDVSSTGATYAAVVVTSAVLSNDVRTDTANPFPLNSTVYIYNTDSERALTWREEGTDEYFLIEVEVSSLVDAAPFRLLEADGVALPCPLLYPPPECHAYDFVSNPVSSTYTDAGFLAYTEDGATYVKAAPSGSVGDLPILLIRSSSSSTANLPFPIIRSVTN